MSNPPPKEDTWAFQSIGAPLLPSPVKCIGEQNMYVALWCKNGKPIHGRSWNNGGVVECSFPYEEAEWTTKAQLEGQIQVLQYVGDHNTQGFWYEWIKYKDRIEKIDDKHQLVRCGDSFPVFWKRPEGNLLGYVDNKTEDAWFSFNGKVIKQTGPQLNDMYIITRNCVGGPPHCECAGCGGLPRKDVPRVERDEWMNIREGEGEYEGGKSCNYHDAAVKFAEKWIKKCNFELEEIKVIMANYPFSTSQIKSLACCKKVTIWEDSVNQFNWWLEKCPEHLDYLSLGVCFEDREPFTLPSSFLNRPQIMHASNLKIWCRAAFSDEQLFKFKAKSMHFNSVDFTDERINKFIRNWTYGKAVDGFEDVYFWDEIYRDPDVLLEGLDEVKEWDEEFVEEQMSYFFPNISNDYDPIVFECNPEYEAWIEVTKYILQLIYMIPGAILNILIFYTIWIKNRETYLQSSYFIIFSIDCIIGFIAILCDIIARFLMYFTPICPFLAPFFFDPLIFFKGIMITQNHCKICKFIIQSVLVFNRMTCVIYPNDYTRSWRKAMIYVIPLIIFIPFGTDWNLAISRVYMTPTFGGFYMEYIKKVSWAGQSRFALIFISIALFFTVTCTSVTLYSLIMLPNRLVKFERLITIASAYGSIGYLILAFLQFFFAFFPSVFSGSMMFGIALLSMDVLTVGYDLEDMT
ncbi:hypothetical protein CAEBREN_08162 [Caenorhabditis brenneri]|uniref:Serpentine receptor class gamma n=1 Tax=Caenorhabditis brenneri TaxID=135651 RepID=G0MEC8_CAEBE|nr:hypothetical protein CAEBREN_08162 [Caenorhabditis brenneri]